MAQLPLPRIAALGALLFAFLMQAAVADDRFRRQVNFDIAAQSVEAALLEFSKQADVQVMVGTLSLNGQKTEGVKGKFSVAQALEQLLKDTGLEYEARGNTVTVKSVKNARADAVVMPLADGVKLASSDARGEAARNGEAPRVREAAEPVTETLDEVVVTGTHIRGQTPIGSQLISFDRADIERSGYATVHELIRTLPQNFSGGASEDTVFGVDAGTNSSKATAINLRALGSGSTLILVNGRRMAPSGTEGAFTDVSTIPATAVERIEVLADGASAIYGSDAVAGVVNFVLRDDYEGAETRARFGGVTSGGMREEQAGQLLGGRWESGSGLVSFEYYHRDALPASARKATSSSDLRSQGGDNFDTRNGNPGTITAGGTTWAIPPNQNGTNLTPGDFTPATTNFHNRNEGRDIFAEQRRLSVVGTARHNITDNVEISVDALFAKRNAESRSPGLATTLTVSSINPFYVNPTGGTGNVRILYNLLDDLGPLTGEADVKASSIGANLRLYSGHGWRTRIGVMHAREDETQVVRNTMNASALTAALNDPNPATAFNPFGDGSFTNPATLDAIRAQTRFSKDSMIRTASVTADGPVLRLSNRDIRLALGAEYRDQSFDSRNRTPDQSFESEFDRNVRALYSELSIPLVDSNRGRVALHRLDLSIAARHERYDDFGSATSPRVGLLWAPFHSTTLRGSWSKSFKAPNLPDLDETNNGSVIFPISDSASPAGFTDILLWFGENADLTEERAEVWTAGIDFKPTFAPGLTVGMTYFDITYKDRIESFEFVDTILDDPQFAPFVTRNPSTEQIGQVCGRSTFLGDPTACSTLPVGAIVDVRTQNSALTKESGLDLLASYAFSSDVGDFELGLNGTYLFKFERALLANSPALDQLNRESNPLDLRLRASVSWNRGGLGFASFLNYADNYWDRASASNRQIDSWTTLDMQLSYDTGAVRNRWLDQLLIALSVQNILDEDPPFVNNPTGVGYDRENADLLGRFWSIQVSKAW